MSLGRLLAPIGGKDVHGASPGQRAGPSFILGSSAHPLRSAGFPSALPTSIRLLPRLPPNSLAGRCLRTRPATTCPDTMAGRRGDILGTEKLRQGQEREHKRQCGGSLENRGPY